MSHPAPASSPEPIFRLAQGFMASKMLFVASELGLFEQLAQGGKTIDELSAGLKLPPRSIGVIANAMVALGMFSLANGQYGNSEVAQAFLSGRGPADLRPLLTFWGRFSYQNWNGLADAVRSDGNKGALFDFSQEDQAVFSAGVEAATTGMAMALASTYDFGPHRRLLDIGGGTGSFLKIIGRRHPHLELTLFETPKTAAYARTRLGPDDAKRLTIVEGDALGAALAPDFDVLLLSHVAHCFNMDDNRVLLTNAHRAATSGARLLVVEFFLDETKTSPLPCALMSGGFLMTGRGIAYSVGEIRRLAESIGWRFIEHRSLAEPASLMVLEK